MYIYELAINNMKAYIRSEQNQKDTLEGKQIDAFTAARIIAVAFMKDQDEVMFDLIS